MFLIRGQRTEFSNSKDKIEMVCVHVYGSFWFKSYAQFACISVIRRSAWSFNIVVNQEKVNIWWYLFYNWMYQEYVDISDGCYRVNSVTNYWITCNSICVVYRLAVHLRLLKLMNYVAPRGDYRIIIYIFLLSETKSIVSYC